MFEPITEAHTEEKYSYSRWHYKYTKKFYTTTK